MDEKKLIIELLENKRKINKEVIQAFEKRVLACINGNTPGFFDDALLDANRVLLAQNIEAVVIRKIADQLLEFLKEFELNHGELKKVIDKAKQIIFE